MGGLVVCGHTDTYETSVSARKGLQGKMRDGMLHTLFHLSVRGINHDYKC